MIVACHHHHFSCMHERADDVCYKFGDRRHSKFIAATTENSTERFQMLRGNDKRRKHLHDLLRSQKKCSSGSLEPFYSLHLGLHRFAVNASINLSFAHQYSSLSSLDMPLLFPTDKLNRLA